MRAAVVAVISLSLLSSACFPNNPRHRTIAKATEAGLFIGGIGMLFVVNTGADCMSAIPGMPDTDCENKASVLGTIGLGLVLTGLIGFIATVSTSPDDKATTVPVTTPAAAPTPAAPAPAADPVPAADPAPDAPDAPAQ